MPNASKYLLLLKQKMYVFMLFDINCYNVSYYTNHYVNYMHLAVIAIKMKVKSTLTSY